MTKLVYPKNGIFNECKDDINSVITNLSNAISNCSFDIPYDFSYRSYLNNLNDKLNIYYDDIKNIKDILKSSNDRFENLEVTLLNDIKKLDDIKIKERDRMIY